MFWNFLLWLGVAVGVLVGVLVVLMLVGIFLPRYHEVRRATEIKQPPQAVWETITDYARVPDWHQEVVKVEKLADHDGHEVWRETYKGNYPITLETTLAEPPLRLVRHIADENGPFAGRWEYTLSPTPAGCRVAITEFGDIANPFFRFMARVLMNPAVYLDLYLTALAKKYGEEAKIS